MIIISEGPKHEKKYFKNSKQTKKKLTRIRNKDFDHLKKRNSTLERADEECKRLRVSVQDMSSEKVRIESELQTNIRRLETITQNRDKLREETIKLENELAVLRAEKQMNEARKDI